MKNFLTGNKVEFKLSTEALLEVVKKEVEDQLKKSSPAAVIASMGIKERMNESGDDRFGPTSKSYVFEGVEVTFDANAMPEFSALSTKKGTSRIKVLVSTDQIKDLLVEKARAALQQVSGTCKFDVTYNAQSNDDRFGTSTKTLYEVCVTVTPGQ